jgi:hypothetical protein
MKGQEKFFLLGFFVLNLFQAAFTQLTGDEALYWMHWNNLDWGFRDHPPAIGAMIGVGYSLFPSELGVRLLVVLANTITLMLLWKLVQPKSTGQFIALLLSIPVMSIYAFMATPDVPLILSVAFYLLTWKNFLEDQSNKNTLLLAVAMAAMVWSKYHGVLVIIFMLLPVRSMWFNKKFWIAGVMGILLFSPHIIWQIVNDLPTVKFHLNDRNSDKWDWKLISGYAGGQFAVFNPIVFVTVIILMIKTKAKTDFERSLRWLINGLLLLFFFNSFRGRVEPHWTACIYLAIVYLLIKLWEVSPPQKWIMRGIVFFATIVFVVRFALVFDVIPAFYREFHRDKNKMLALKEVAGDLPVCFMNSYQNPSLYSFYTGGIAHSINNTGGGRNQFDFWNYNEFIHKKPFLFVASYDAPGFEKASAGKFQFDVKRLNDLPVLHGLTVWTDDWLFHFHQGDSVNIPGYLINRNNYDLNLKDPNHTIQWRALFNFKKPNQAIPDLEIDGMPDFISANDSVRINLRFKLPELTGRNYLMIAAQIDDLPATYQSNKMRVMVK